MKHSFKMALVFMLFLSASFLSSRKIQAIENGRNDLGILDSLKITNSFGYEATNGTQIHNGEQYTLMYRFSLDEPTSDYQNKVATFDIPDIFKSESLNPAPMKLMYNDGTTNYEIGTVTANATTGKISVQFNDSSVLGTKSNITGWISLTAIADATVGNHDVVVSWNGSNETSINVKVDNGYIGPDREAQVNKYVSSGLQPNGQPTVLQKQDGSFYITFMIEVFVSKDYADLSVQDDIYAGLKVDDASVKVVSRPKDGSVYYSPTNTVYKANYDAWKLDNLTGPKAVDKDITAELNSENKIQTEAEGLQVNFENVDFDSQLASRQLTSIPSQLRYKIIYDTLLTNIDPTLSLSEAQVAFESLNARNDVKLLSSNQILNETSWVKSALGGGASGETRSLTLKKVDSQTQEELSGAVFNLYKQNAYDSNLWELYTANITMNSNSVVVNGLTFGNYRIQEIVAPVGYILPEGPFDAFTVDATTALTGLEITLENSKQPVIVEYGSVQFEKVDGQDSSIKLVATFEVRKKATDEVVATVTTNTSGVGSVQSLEVGDYYLIETVAPTGYQLDATKHDFSVTKDTMNQVYFGSFAITNTKQTPIIEYGSVQFEKVDGQDSSIKLVATFEVRKKATDEVVATVTTNTSGIGSVQSLEVGDYYLIETVAPTGYQLDATKHDFSVTKDTMNQVYFGSFAITNTKQTPIIEYGSVQFEKVDGQDSSIKLVATFEVRKKTTDEVVATVTTNTSGVGSVQSLEVGDYYLIETVAPTGYKLDSVKYDFTIEKDTVNKKYFSGDGIKNFKLDEKKPDKEVDRNVQAPSTGDESNMVEMLMLIAISGFFVVFMNKRGSINS